MKILGISGSIFGTKSRIALNEIGKYFSSDTEFEIMDLKELNIEFSDGRDYRDYSGDTAMLINKIIEADVLLIASPVFQASIPGALKNVFDLLPIDSLRNKSVGIIMNAGSSRHFLVAEYQLKPILNYMKAKVLEHIVYIEADAYVSGKIIDDEIVMRLERYASDLELQAKRQIMEKELEEASYDF